MRMTTTSRRAPLAGAIAGLAHDDATVLIVNEAVTALVPETVVLAIEKHPFASDGLPDTAHEIVPV